MKPVRYQKVRDRVFRLGWRYTFERLVMANVPGVTRESLGEKFGVDMHKYPVGAPDEVQAFMTEE